jgi:hypothetical protein
MHGRYSAYLTASWTDTTIVERASYIRQRCWELLALACGILHLRVHAAFLLFIPFHLIPTPLRHRFSAKTQAGSTRSTYCKFIERIDSARIMTSTLFLSLDVIFRTAILRVDMI